MEPISLSMAGLILASMAAGAVLSNFMGKKKSCCVASAGEDARPAQGGPSSVLSNAIDEEKEKAINDLLSEKS